MDGAKADTWGHKKIMLLTKLTVKISNSTGRTGNQREKDVKNNIIFVTQPLFVFTVLALAGYVAIIYIFSPLGISLHLMK